MKRGGEGRGVKKTVSSSPCEPAGLRDGTIIFLTGGGGVMGGRGLKNFLIQTLFYMQLLL